MSKLIDKKQDNAQCQSNNGQGDTKNEVNEPIASYSITSSQVLATVEAHKVMPNIDYPRRFHDRLSHRFKLSDPLIHQGIHQSFDTEVELNASSTIYLDSSIWLMLTEAYIDHDAPLLSRTLLQSMLYLRTSRDVIFPLSIDAFLAVLSSTEITYRRDVLQLLEKLSSGMCILPFVHRAAQEMEGYIKHSLGVHHSLAPYDERRMATCSHKRFVRFSEWVLSQERLLLPTFAKGESTKQLIKPLVPVSLVELFADKSESRNRVTMLRRLATPIDYLGLEGIAKDKIFQEALSGILGFLKPYFDHRLSASDWLVSTAEGPDKKASLHVLLAYVYHTLRLPNNFATFRKHAPSLFVYVLTHAAAHCGKNAELLPHLIQSQAALPHCDYYFSRFSIEQSFCWLPKQSMCEHVMADFNCQFTNDIGTMLTLLNEIERYASEPVLTNILKV